MRVSDGPGYPSKQFEVGGAPPSPAAPAAWLPSPPTSLVSTLPPAPASLFRPPELLVAPELPPRTPPDVVPAVTPAAEGLPASTAAPPSPPDPPVLELHAPAKASTRPAATSTARSLAFRNMG